MRHTRRKFSPEYRDEAVKMVTESSRPIAEVARELGINEGTLGNWVNKYRSEHFGEEPALNISERARLRELERETGNSACSRVPEKSGGLLRPGAAVSECYEFIAAEEGDAASPYPLSKMCSWLGVSRSGFYEWRTRCPSPTARRRWRLITLIRAVFEHSRGTYGYRRVHAALVRSGEHVGPELVRALMVQLGLVACQPRPFRTTTVPDAAAAAAIPDRLAGDFSAEAPGQRLVGDITYVETWEGWLYLATVIDCYSKKIVGWSMAEHMRTGLVISALDMATGNLTLTEDAVFHPDRGGQYTSAEYHSALHRHGISPSVGRTGICWDNALADSTFVALKNELIHRTVFPTRRHARRAIAEYIEVFYNRQRLHSGLGYKTPHEVHTEYLEPQMAA